jgi:photosystem II stability/assembly factor-like uncharacterized protein
MISSLGICRTSFVAVFLLIANSAVHAFPQTKPSAIRSTQKTASASPDKYKGIFEPANYPEDVELTDVFFIDADNGWASGKKNTDAGEGGFIINTHDGGKTWKTQMGDPHSATRAVARLFFLDATHGWASQYGSKLLRTTDGENWETAGDFRTGQQFIFVSPKRGFTVASERLTMTIDGGVSWKPQFECRAKVDVNGLPHEDTCHFQAADFPTPTIGYAVTSEVSDKSSVVFKTEDAGKTWKIVSFIPQATGIENSFGFLDENTGFVCTYQGKMLGTNDGGKTWRGIPTNVPGGRPRIEFANPTGWTMQGKMWAYTTDGGKRWLSREVAFPTDVNAFSLPRSDRGYVVGDHGMVYRYHVVPADYTVAHGINAPVMPKSEGNH